MLPKAELFHLHAVWLETWRMPQGSYEDAHLIVSCHDEFSKFLGSCNVTAFSNVNEVGIWSNPEGL